jgi:hypothetical protein
MAMIMACTLAVNLTQDAERHVGTRVRISRKYSIARRYRTSRARRDDSQEEKNVSPPMRT